MFLSIFTTSSQFSVIEMTKKEKTVLDLPQLSAAAMKKEPIAIAQY
jgi:hypothetical protein